MEAISRPPRPKSAHARVLKADTKDSTLRKQQFQDIGSLTDLDSLEFTGSLTSVTSTRPKSAGPKLQRSRFPADFSMSIDVSETI